MCYHELYIFLGCGHATYSQKPILRAPSCSKKRNSNDNTKDHVLSVLDHSISNAVTTSWEVKGKANFIQTHRDENLEKSIKTRERSDSDESRLSSKFSGNSNITSNGRAESDSGYGSKISSTRNGSQISCSGRQSHPLYTFRVNAICHRCQVQRCSNLAITEACILHKYVRKGMLRRKSTIITSREDEEPLQISKEQYRYQYHSDDTREEVLRTQMQDIESESDLPPEPISFEPKGRRDRNRRVTGYIDPESREDKPTIIPLLAGTYLTHTQTSNTPTIQPSSKNKPDTSQPTETEPEKPLPPVPQSPPSSSSSSDQVTDTDPPRSNRSSTSSSSDLSAKITAVEQTWRAAKAFTNVNRDVLGRNVKGMDKIMGWKSKSQSQSQWQQGKRQQRQSIVTDGYQKVRASSVTLKMALQDQNEDVVEKHTSTGALRIAAI